jgi:hypothetical protein
MFKSWMFNPVSPQELQTSNLFSTLAVSGSVAGGLDQCGEQVAEGKSASARYRVVRPAVPFDGFRMPWRWDS